MNRLHWEFKKTIPARAVFAQVRKRVIGPVFNNHSSEWWFWIYEIHIFAPRWRDESKRSSQLRTLLKRVVIYCCTNLPQFTIVFLSWNRFLVAVHLFNNKSQMTPKCGKNKKGSTRGAAECVTDVLNPSTPKIWLLILPSSCYTFPCKWVTRMWCQIEITTSIW